MTALTGIDAIAHALETYVTKARNPVSLAFSREAWLLLARELCAACSKSRTTSTPAAACNWARASPGLAIENSMLGATHALANPLTARYGIVHGQAIGLMLPHVIRFNGAAGRRLVSRLAGRDRRLERLSAHPAAASRAGRIRGRAGPTGRLAASGLSECGVERDKLPQLAAEAAKQWTGGFNPRKRRRGGIVGVLRSGVLAATDCSHGVDRTRPSKIIGRSAATGGLVRLMSGECNRSVDTPC